MPTTPFILRVEAEYISPGDFSAAVAEWVGLLYDLERELAPTRERALAWRITELGQGSWVVGAEAEATEDSADIGPYVARSLTRGLALIERGKRPPEYTDEMVERVGRLSSLVGNGTRAIHCDAPTVQRTFTITRMTGAKVEAVIGEGYTSIGSIEGTIEALSIHGRPTFTVYDAVTGRAVRCELSDSMRRTVMSALGSKVSVHGEIRRDATGRPTALRKIDRFRRLGLKASVPVESLAGIFKGLGDSRQHLAGLRGE
jgi:hypothetical protein